MKPRTIPEPKLSSARPLSPLDLNKFHFNPKHTVLTPATLMNLVKDKDTSKDVAASDASSSHVSTVN